MEMGFDLNTMTYVGCDASDVEEIAVNVMFTEYVVLFCVTVTIRGETFGIPESVSVDEQAVIELAELLADRTRELLAEMN